METLHQEGIEAESHRSAGAAPLDMPTVLASVARTRRVVIVDEGWKTGSLSAEIAARIIEGAFFELDAPIQRVCSREVPVPYPAHLELGSVAAGAGDRRRGARNGEERMIEFRMPSLGADMEAGTLVEWLVQPGARVKRGDVVAVVETQKGAIEIEIFNDGVVTDLAIPIGQRVPVGSGARPAGRAAQAMGRPRQCRRPLRRSPASPPVARRHGGPAGSGQDSAPARVSRRPADLPQAWR